MALLKANIHKWTKTEAPNYPDVFPNYFTNKITVCHEKGKNLCLIKAINLSLGYVVWKTETQIAKWKNCFSKSGLKDEIKFQISYSIPKYNLVAPLAIRRIS
jgi:hypothetical protein